MHCTFAPSSTIQSGHWELSELHKEVDLTDNNDNILFTYGAYYKLFNILFTYGAYYKLFSNAAHVVGVRQPYPLQTGKLAQHQSGKDIDNKFLCCLANDCRAYSPLP